MSRQDVDCSQRELVMIKEHEQRDLKCCIDLKNCITKSTNPNTLTISVLA